MLWKMLFQALWGTVCPSLCHHPANLIVQDFVPGGAEVKACDAEDRLSATEFVRVLTDIKFAYRRRASQSRPDFSLLSSCQEAPPHYSILHVPSSQPRCRRWPAASLSRKAPHRLPSLLARRLSRFRRTGLGLPVHQLVSPRGAGTRPRAAYL